MGIPYSTTKYNPIPLDKDNSIYNSGFSHNDGVYSIRVEPEKFKHKKVSNTFKRYRDYDKRDVV